MKNAGCCGYFPNSKEPGSRRFSLFTRVSFTSLPNARSRSARLPFSPLA